jgi:hypothetical protein
VEKLAKERDGAVGRVGGLGVTLPGVPGDTDNEIKRVFIGLAPRTVVDVAVEDPAVDWRGRPTGVTKPVEVPEMVRDRGCTEGVGVGLVGAATRSAFDNGTNIPELDVEVEKYRTPATLPSFFP